MEPDKVSLFGQSKEFVLLFTEGFSVNLILSQAKLHNKSSKDHREVRRSFMKGDTAIEATHTNSACVGPGPGAVGRNRKGLS